MTNTTAKSDIKSWYARAASQYDDDGLRWEKTLDEHLFASIKNTDSNNFLILDMACGTGIYLALIEQRLLSFHDTDKVKVELIGLDVSAEMLSKAEEKTTLSKFIQGNASSLPLASMSVDFACLQSALHLIDNKDNLLSEIYRILKRGGLFSILTVDPWKMDRHWIYSVFPTTRDFDQSRFLSTPDLKNSLTTVGFLPSNIQVYEREVLIPMTVNDTLGFTQNRWNTSQFFILAEQDWEIGLLQLQQMAKSQDHVTLWWHEIEVNVYAKKA